MTKRFALVLAMAVGFAVAPQSANSQAVAQAGRNSYSRERSAESERLRDLLNMGGREL